MNESRNLHVSVDVPAEAGYDEVIDMVQAALLKAGVHVGEVRYLPSWYGDPAVDDCDDDSPLSLEYDDDRCDLGAYGCYDITETELEPPF